MRAKSPSFASSTRTTIGTSAAVKSPGWPGSITRLVAVCETGKRRPLVEAARGLDQDLKERFGLELSLSMLSKREALESFDVADGWQLLPSEQRPTISSAR
jgi:hypothetical protein